MDRNVLINRIIAEMHVEFDSGDLTLTRKLLNDLPGGYLNDWFTYGKSPKPRDSLPLPKGTELEWHISTAHITEGDSRLLGGMLNWAFTTDGGWSVSINLIASQNIDISEFSVAFNHIIKIAKDNGISSVRFDRDVPSLCDLKTFDW